ncbi:MAG: TIGR03086 family metal-binding protein [Acidimicrobiia bacterium]
MEPTELLERTFDEVQRVVDGVQPDQMGASTPCREWDVRALLNHMTGAVIMFGNALTDAGAPPEGDVVGDDPSGVFRQASKTTLDAWRQPGALDRTMQLPMGEMPGAIAININLMDAYVHGLDLAVATGQEDTLDAGLAEMGLSMSKELDLDRFRMPGVFGPEVQCGESAAPHRRLLAYLGREV